MRTSRLAIEKMIVSLEQIFPVWILRDSIKLHTEFFMMPAFTRSSKVLREKDINDLELSKRLLLLTPLGINIA